MARKPPVWLKPGDTVEVEIDHLGTLRNTVAAEVNHHLTCRNRESAFLGAARLKINFTSSSQPGPKEHHDEHCV